MNAPIIRLFGVMLVLFAGLVGASSWWTVVRAEEIQDHPLNARSLLQGLEVERGAIRASDGTLLARSVPAGQDTWEREYTRDAALVSHALGYYYPLGIGDAGTERFRADALSGQTDSVGTLFDQIVGSRAEQGDGVLTNLDLDAQRVAMRQLGDRKGAVVAIEPDTGRVQVMASVPGFNPATLEDDEVFTRLATDEENSPLLNRATQSGSAPGSTFKVLTAVAALDSGRFTPTSTLDGSSPQIFSGVPLQNLGNQSFGPVTLNEAMVSSINTVWARVGVTLGPDTMQEYMERFGFYEKPPLDYPDSQLRPSGLYDAGELVEASSGTDLGRVAIGQGQLLATPLQMAMVAAAVANDGVLMEPRITRRIVDREGSTVDDVGRDRVRRVMSKRTAQQITQMMVGVVDRGSGTAAQIPGVRVAGKTGTAEIDIASGVNQPWFIAFAPADDPEVAIAATLDEGAGLMGGLAAAPVARAVLAELLTRR